MSDEDAVFAALCQVQRDAAGGGGPEASLVTFLRAFERASVNDVDEFPDLSEDEARRGAAPEGAAEPPEPTPAGDGRAAVLDALMQTLGAYQGLLARFNRDFDDVFARRAHDNAETDDETVRRLREAQTLLVKYPVAAQAAFAALVREGRSFARTADGAAWRRRLVGSPLLARARTLFEGLAGGIVGAEEGPLPTVYVHAFMRALDSELEVVLAEVDGAGVRR